MVTMPGTPVAGEFRDAPIAEKTPAAFKTDMGAPPPPQPAAPKNFFDQYNEAEPKATMLEQGSTGFVDDFAKKLTSLDEDLSAGVSQAQQSAAATQFLAADEDVNNHQDSIYPPRIGESLDDKIENRDQKLLDIAKYAHLAAQHPVSPAVQDFNDAKGFWEGTKAWASAPFSVTKSLAFRSLPASSPAILGGIGGMLTGGPWGAAVGAGTGSAVSEFGSAITDELQARGADLNDEASIFKVWREHGPEIVRYAKIRAGIIGTFDAASGGLGSKAVEVIGGGTWKRRAGQFLAGTAIDMLGGGGGEATQELVNKGELSAPDVLGEIFAGTGQAVIQTGGQMAVNNLMPASVEATTRPTAPWAPRVRPAAPWAPRNPSGPDGPATPATLMADHGKEALDKAQVELFGEVIGTRNLTPEQLNELDDHINSGGEIPQAPPETVGGLTNEDLPPLPEGNRPGNQPVPGVPVQGQQEGQAPGPDTKGAGQTSPGAPLANGFFADGYGEGGKYRVSSPSSAGGAIALEKRNPAGRPDAFYIGTNGQLIDADTFSFHKDTSHLWRPEAGSQARQEATAILQEWGSLKVNDPRREQLKARLKQLVTGEAPAATAASPTTLSGEYRDFKPSELKVDAKRFQFKEGGNEEGVTDRLSGIKTWDQSKAGVTLVWESKEGDFYIADGHQRHALATRLADQDPKIHAYIVREVDGVTAERARAMAASKNIAEGTGNAVDAAKILRDTPTAGLNLPPNSALVRDAKGLAALSPDAFGMVINKKIAPGYAAIVGRLAPDPATHAELLSLLAKNEPANAIEAESIVRDALDAPAVQSTMEDMFGTAQVTQILFKERAQILSAASSAIRKDRAAFNTLVKEADRITQAGNKLATDANTERANLDAELLAHLQASARRKGPIADALAQAAKRLHDGESKQAVIRDFLDVLRKGDAGNRAAGGRAGASGRQDEIAASLGGYRRTESPAFKRYFGESQVVDANGEPLVMYRGDYRGDKVGEMRVIPESEGGSGALYFTDAAPIASGYSTSKQYMEGNWDDVLTNTVVKLNGKARPMARVNAFLSRAQKQTIEEGVLTFGERENGNGIGAADPMIGRQTWQEHLQRAGGDYIKAANSVLLESGAASREEFLAFLDDLKIFNSVHFDDPAAPASTVTPVYLSIKKPLDVATLSDADIEAIASRVPKDDLTLMILRDRGSVTVVTDAMRDALESMGYDGIRDVGGRMTGTEAHQVYLAFRPHQVKSIFNRGTWDATNPNISFSAAPPPGLTFKVVGRDIEAVVNGQVVGYLNLESYGEKAARNEAFNMAVKPAWQRKGIMAALHREAERLFGPMNPSGTLSDEGFAFWKGYRPEAVKDDLRFRKQELIGKTIPLSGGRTGEIISVGANNVSAHIIGMERGSTNSVSTVRRAAVESLLDQPAPVEPGAEGLPQLVIPGAERVSDKTLAERQAAAPMRGTRPQKGLDFGLFGAERDQLDLVDLLGIPRMVQIDGQYLDFRPGSNSKTAVLGNTTITYAAHDGEIEILSVRTPMAMRGQGAARDALVTLLEKADNEGLKVRAYSTPLDRATTGEGIIRFFESLGFTPTGRRNPAGDIEMMREGPPPGLKELRTLVGDGSLVPLQDYREAGLARQVAKVWIETQPERTFDDLYSGRLQRNQDNLDGLGMDIADRLGVEYSMPGVKKRVKAEEKIGRKLYTSTRQLTDLVRSGFVLDHPDQAQRIINILASRYRVLDEGWNINDVSYFDRKVLVQFPDGTLGEVQFWERSLLNAKDNLGGHKAYKARLALPKEDPARLILQKQQIDLYESVIAGLSPDWLAVIGRSDTSGNIVEKAAGDISRPESTTSSESTSVQGLPLASTAQALKPSMTAGLHSQLKNLTGTPSDQGIAFSGKPQPQTPVPVNRPQGGIPGQARRPAEPLAAIAADLHRITGAPVRQGRLARMPKGMKAAGQYDRNQGVIRLRDMTDYDTNAHETAHSLETEYGRTLHGIKVAHQTELEPLAYPGADPRVLLSEGFAEWFRFYLTTPGYARRVAPNFTKAFEAMVDPDQLRQIEDLQARYKAWSHTPSGAAVSADVVSSRKGGALSEAVEEISSEGLRPTLGVWANKVYAGSIDKLNPIAKMVDELQKIYEERTGQALNIRTADDPYRLARLLGQAYAAGHIDLMQGIVPYRGTQSEGPSLADFLGDALGYQWKGWDDTLMADLAAYAIARRSIQEYDRYDRNEIPNPPGKFTRGDYEVTVAEAEANHPEWVGAIEKLYEMNRNLLRKKFEAGFITQDLYEELLQRKDYVPLMRDMTDLDREVGVAPNKTLRNSVMKAFKGSKRAVINPFESIAADIYMTAALIKRNDVFKALDDLARQVGPGAGYFVERIPSTQLEATTVQITEALRSAAKANGLQPDEVDHLTAYVDDILGANAEGTVFRAGEINDKKEPIIYVWRDGRKTALRLADGDFGKQVYEALTQMTKEQANLVVSALSIPTQTLRYGITTHPTFFVANILRDQVSTFVNTGMRYLPFIDNFIGMAKELALGETSQRYNIGGGVVGGGNVAGLRRGWQKRDIAVLQKKGYKFKRFLDLNGFAEFTTLSEMGTRIQVFARAEKRAKAEGLSDYEAMVEGAYQATDLFDWGRHGSRTQTARRLVTFLNAGVQGVNKHMRTMGGEKAFRKIFTGRPLTTRDKANITTAYRAWFAAGLLATIGYSMSVLYQDDPDYEEIPERIRATHWVFKDETGTWRLFPKPFEVGSYSNIAEKAMEATYGNDPTAMAELRRSLYQITAPPMEVPAIETFYNLRDNVDSTGRPIVSQALQGLEPWAQYTGRTSELSKALGYVTNTSPEKIDTAIQGFGGSWGRTILDTSSALIKGENPFAAVADSFAHRFTWDYTRGSESTTKFWQLVSETNGAMALKAYTYNKFFETSGQAAADQVLNGADENTKAFAILMTHFDADHKRQHPLVRAADVIGIANAMKREIANSDLRTIDTKKDPAEEQDHIVLSPDDRQTAQRILSKVAAYEARNALKTIGEPGWAQRKYGDTESVLADLKDQLPAVYDEWEARIEAGHILDDEEVRANWPDIKEQLLTDGPDAQF